jgi:predicted Fe-S protein YdhL (DUF1289 family)
MPANLVKFGVPHYGAPAHGLPTDMTTSPCIGVCKLDKVTKLCLGCRRSVAEISAWLDLSEDERQAIIARLNASAGGPTVKSN